MKHNKKILPLLLLSAAIFTTAYASDEGESFAESNSSAVPVKRPVLEGDDSSGSSTGSTTSSTARTFALSLNRVKPHRGISPPLRRGPPEQPETKYSIQLWGKECSFEKEQLDRALALFRGRDTPVTIESWLEQISTFIVAPDEQQKNRASHAFLTQHNTGYQPVLGEKYFQNLYAFLILLFQHAAENPLVPEQDAIAEALRVYGDENGALKDRVEQLGIEVREKEASTVTIADLRKQLAALEKAKQEETEEKIKAIREKTQAIDRIAAAEGAKNTALDAKKDIERRADEAESRVENNAEILRTLRTQLDEERQRAAAAEAATQQAHVEREVFEQRHCAGEGERQRLQDELAELRQSSETERQALRTQLAAETQRAAAAGAAREVFEQRNREGEATRQALRTQLDEERQCAAAAEAARETSEQRNREGEATRQDLQTRLDEVTQRADAAESAVENNAATLRERQDQLEEATRRATFLEGQNRDLQVQVGGIVALNTTIDSLRRDLVVAQPLAASVHDLQQQLRQLQAQLVAVRAAALAQPAAAQNGEIVIHKGTVRGLEQD